MPDLTRPESDLFERVAAIIEAARGHVARTVNTTMVHAYWHVGREIVEVDQKGADRAAYGEGLMKRLAEHLSTKFGKGFSLAGLKRMKQFYLAFPRGSVRADAGERIGSTALSLSDEADATEKAAAALSLSPTTRPFLFPPLLAWSHYPVLLRVEKPAARSFYEVEAAREGWSVRRLERQIASLLFERLAMNKNQDEILALARRGQEVAVPADVIKDPFVLEFLEPRRSCGPSSHTSAKRRSAWCSSRRRRKMSARRRPSRSPSDETAGRRDPRGDHRGAEVRPGGKGPRQRLRFTKTGGGPLEEAYSRQFLWPGKRPLHPPRSSTSTRGERTKEQLDESQG